MNDSLDDFAFEMPKHWLAATYEQEDNFIRSDGQTQGQFNSASNFSLEPDGVSDFELECTMYAGDSAFTKRHTMPGFGISPISPNSHNARSAHSVSTSPKRAETYPLTIEGFNIARNEKLLNILSKLDPETTPPSSERGSEASDTSNVAQSLQVNTISGPGFEEWAVPICFLRPPPPELDRADDLTTEGSLKPLENFQSKDIEGKETNDCCNMAEGGVDSVPPLNPSFGWSAPYFKVTHSDSGMGSSTKSIKQGPHSYRRALSYRGGRSSRDSQAKESVVLDRASVSASMAAGSYQQVAAKIAPLTSAASSTAGSVETLQILSEAALKTMKKIILEPILNENNFSDFWDICKIAREHIEGGWIRRLRDLEKFLHLKASNIKNNQAYKNFCIESLNRVKESLKYMPQNELLRPGDRPYDNGYFLDTMASFDESTIQSAEFEWSQEEDDSTMIQWPDEMESQPSQLSLPEKRVAEADSTHGGLAKRPKPDRPGLITDTQNYPDNGYSNLSALSGSTTQKIMTPNPGLIGPPAIPQPRMKSGSPTQHPRNKPKHRGRVQQVKEQQVFPCNWDGCAHPAFTRACDLTKHQKTHTRPHKCTVANCKYATEGFPTEKERDRHFTDKHSSNTPAFHCCYVPCTYKSKRESNCKQHMEKAHGYTYVRMKQNYKANSAKRQNNSPTSPGDQDSPMGASPPSQQNFVAQTAAMAPQYQAQAPVDSGFPQTRHQHRYQYSEQDITTLILCSMNSEPQDTFMFGENQEHTNATDSFSHQPYTAPYPDALDPRYLDYTPMPVPPMPDENIDPNLDMINDLSMNGTQGYGGLTT